MREGANALLLLELESLDGDFNFVAAVLVSDHHGKDQRALVFQFSFPGYDKCSRVIARIQAECTR